MIKFYNSLKSLLASVDPRALAAGVAVAGAASWLAPAPWLPLLFIPACCLMATAARLMTRGARLLGVYLVFALLWSVARFALHLAEHPGSAGPALEGALILGARLFSMLGLALAIPLALTPVQVGRVLGWFLRGPALLEALICSLPPLRGRLRPRLAELAWRAALALALMMCFFPRALSLLLDLRRSLALRAPHLPLHRRLGLMGMAALRVLGQQTWDMAIAITARDLYKREVWEHIN